jgi:hypothetical protein
MIEWTMFITFILALGLSLWKLKAFFPSEQLHDDDRTVEAENELMQMMLSSIEACCIAGSTPTLPELFLHMRQLSEFDEARYWRFNHNRLRQLLEKYYLLNPDTSSIADICEKQTTALTETSAV